MEAVVCMEHNIENCSVDDAILVREEPATKTAFMERTTMQSDIKNNGRKLVYFLQIRSPVSNAITCIQLLHTIVSFTTINIYTMFTH